MNQKLIEQKDLEHVWNREIGEGESGGTITSTIVDGAPGFYLSVSYEAEVKLEDAELCAQEFERLAAEIRNQSLETFEGTETANSLKQLRTLNGVTVDALAEVTGMHSKVIEALESGAIVPERVQVQRLSEGVTRLIKGANFD